MHEAQLARQIVEIAVSRAAREGATRVRVVRGWVSESEALSEGSLALHFALHAQGTPAEGARLELRLERVAARCRACAATWLPEHHVAVCPECGAVDGELLGRVGLGVDEIDVE